MIQNMISDSRINKNKESSACSEIKSASVSVKRARHHEEINNNAAGSLTFQKFKGVVPQQNGNWGAQIYANHQRIWLGTFKSEKEAAMAYDSASIKLRSGESHRNFPWNDETVQEAKFQSHYSAEIVLSMIRDGTYQSNFATFLSTHETQQGGVTNKHITLKGEEQFYCTQLFQKELTPSDVGKLNRLVIPKKHAVTYFPYVCGNTEEGNDHESVDLEVVFYDKLMRSWKFRYCYWKSSQSYVFTRGWNRFVKDKKLKAKDVIVFSMCEPVDWRKVGEREAFALIDVIYNNADQTKMCFGESTGNEFACSQDQETNHGNHNINAQKGLRLFGVCIT